MGYNSFGGRFKDYSSRYYARSQATGSFSSFLSLQAALAKSPGRGEVTMDLAIIITPVEAIKPPQTVIHLFTKLITRI